MSVNNISQPVFVKLIDDRGKEQIINRDKISSVEMGKGEMVLLDKMSNVIACIPEPKYTLSDVGNKLGDVIDLTA